MDYIKYINWPRVPDSILKNIPNDDSEYKIKFNYSTFNWSESNNQELDAWAKQNISQDMYFAFSLTKGDLVLHKDVNTILKLNYVINPGGEKVVTKFWADDKKHLLAEYVIEPHRWHIFKSDTYHSVHGIEKNQTRFSVTAQIF